MAHTTSAATAAWPTQVPKTAIAVSDDVVAADEIGVAGDALRDKVRMLDEVRFRLYDLGNNDFALPQLDLLEPGPFMRVARVCASNEITAGPLPTQYR